MWTTIKLVIKKSYLNTIRFVASLLFKNFKCRIKVIVAFKNSHSFLQFLFDLEAPILFTLMIKTPRICFPYSSNIVWVLQLYHDTVLQASPKNISYYHVAWKSKIILDIFFFSSNPWIIMSNELKQCQGLNLWKQFC